VKVGSFYHFLYDFIGLACGFLRIPDRNAILNADAGNNCICCCRTCPVGCAQVSVEANREKE